MRFCLRNESEPKWFGLVEGENFSQRRLYNGVRLWFMVNNITYIYNNKRIEKRIIHIYFE